jgi:hypothetical protein
VFNLFSSKLEQSEAVVYNQQEVGLLVCVLYPGLWPQEEHVVDALQWATPYIGHKIYDSIYKRFRGVLF